MVERLDADTRREAIADAVGRVLMRRGASLPGLREIAAEAGLTTGAIQHHFGSKDDVLLFALEHHGRRWVRRLEARAAQGARSPTPRRVLRAIVEELIPLDAERAAETAVATAFVLHAALDDRLAGLYRRQRASLLTLVSAQFGRTGLSDSEQRANLLLQAVDGMRTDCLLLGADSVDIDATLDRLLVP